MTVVMPLTLVQPIVPPLQPNLSKRNVAAPRRSVPRAVVLVQQPTHPILCYFEDLDVEQKFQTYFRREWQTFIVGNMVVVLLAFAGWSYASSNAATLAITEAYAASIFAELEIFTYCIIVVAELSLIAIVTTGIHEARRLSSANLETKEELSGKLNYELHYEMGDILRILCQIKVKMSAAEKLDIDKIITALVRNHDLFEVTLSSAMPEFEEEVQGWLHMMDFKDHPAQSGDDPGSQTKPGSDGRRSRHYSLSNDILRVSTYSNLDDAFDAVIRPREGDLSSWLMDRLQNHFFVDIFYLEQHCLAPLQAVFLACVKTNGLIERLDLDEKKLVCFAAAVEERYQNRNPYHNPAAAHDISHPGVSNGFLIATKSNLAITYSDDSVLERMHIAELYRILSHDAFDVFSTMGAAERAECRKIIIGMILATDLARHFQRISVLKTKTFAMSEQAQGLELSLLMETMLMLADLGHTAKPFAYHETWAERISEEFFRQGETEERNNLPISPLCDRKQANLPRSQVTFLTLVATPLFETAGQVFSIDEYDTVISELRNNIAMWKGRIEHAEGTVLETLSADSHKSKTLKENAS
ncbi:hypothetical protein JG688_00000781 [Phytophthora aleatoria]|uniref:Phosphodiesterase n=1 Tax=Phytophthora aleatoria TaxID=2496075 RepID=A0A8J5J4P5_9STRA|nr:hypothetical protein JG688_00000781 [Phytophthora aleatoria]